MTPEDVIEQWFTDAYGPIYRKDADRNLEAKQILAALAAAGHEVNPAGTANVRHVKQMSRIMAERDAARAQMQSLTEDYVATEARAIQAESRLAALLDAIGDPDVLRKMALDITDGPENTWADELAEIEMALERIADAAAATQEDQ